MAETAIAYGDSGVGKTTICVHLSKWIYERWGLTTRLISTEGWEPVENEGLIKAGIVKAFNPTSAKKFLTATRKLSRGYWPEVVEKDVAQLDENGIQIGSHRRKVLELVDNPAEFNKIGLYFIETTDGISSAYMNFIKQEEIMSENERGELKLRAIGPQGTAGRFEQDGEILGGNSEGHYGVVQTEMYSLMKAFNSLKGNLKLVFWTSHTGMGKLGQNKTTGADGKKRRTGESCYSPLLAGEAKNAEVPGWVGECFHMEDVPLIYDENGQISQQKQVRAFYENHREEGFIDGPQYRCKSRVSPSDVEELHQKFPGGFIPLGVGQGQGLDQYYRWLEEIKGRNVNKVNEWKEQIDASRNRT